MPAGKVCRLAQPEQKHGYGECEVTEKNARPGQHRCDALHRQMAMAKALRVPEACRVSPPGDHHADGVSAPGRLARDVSVFDAVEARNHALKKLFKVGDHAAVDVCDDRGEEKKRADDPSQVRLLPAGARSPGEAMEPGTLRGHLVQLLRYHPSGPAVVRPIIPATRSVGRAPHSRLKAGKVARWR